MNRKGLASIIKENFALLLVTGIKAYNENT